MDLEQAYRRHVLELRCPFHLAGRHRDTGRAFGVNGAHVGRVGVVCERLPEDIHPDITFNDVGQIVPTLSQIDALESL